MQEAIAQNLASPAAASGNYPYEEAGITLGADSELLSELQGFIDNEMDILIGTLNNPVYIDNFLPANAISVPSITYVQREAYTPIQGGLSTGDYLFGATSTETGEVSSITANRAYVKHLLKRFTVTFTNPLQTFSVGSELIVPSTTNTCTVFSIDYRENVSYIDVLITNGTIGATNTLRDDNTTFEATVDAVADRMQVIGLVGSFTNDDYARSSRSSSEFDIIGFEDNRAPITSNTGGKLTLETEFIQGSLDVSRVVYSSISDIYIDTFQSYEGTQVGIGDVIKTSKIYKVRVSYPFSTQETFTKGGTIVNVLGGIIQDKRAVIIDQVEENGDQIIYYQNLSGSNFAVGEYVAYYETVGTDPEGYGEVLQVYETDSLAFGTVERVQQIGQNYRVYLSGVLGTFNKYAQIIGIGYRSSVVDSNEIKGRITRSFRGFDGTQTSFKLTINNGTPYLPDPDGYLLTFVNGVLQPAGDSFSAFSDTISFTEAPELGSTFHAVYMGKLRQLDNIAFDFDSLSSSFNLKLNDVFYSLTITEGSQSTTIRPENNIIVSLNGVIQEPGVAFEIVGSRINFAEIPRAGSTFVAYSYIGSDADVVAATVVPPIESGDKLEIEGEDEERTVALVESSNSLVTFDYLGSIFGRNAAALSRLKTGRISDVQLTSGGDGYTSRPTVSINSATGFDSTIKALVGVARIDVVNRGSGYVYPSVLVDTDVPEIEGGASFDSAVGTFDNTEATFDGV